MRRVHPGAESVLSQITCRCNGMDVMDELGCVRSSDYLLQRSNSYENHTVKRWILNLM